MTHEPRVVTFGETMAMFRGVGVGSLAHVSDLHLSMGGAESNVAIALVRLGVAASWLGRLGNDSLGERVSRELRAEGVDVRAIIDTDAPTGLMVKEQRTSDATRVYYYRAGSAGSRLVPDDLALIDLASASLLHVTGITPALSESAASTMTAALDAAALADVPVSFDVNHRSKLWKGRDASATYQHIAERSRVVFAGEDEARILAPGATTPQQLAHAIADLGPTQVVIKLGERGCFATIDGEDYEQAAVPIRVLDTVGAGDAFVAGYLAELLGGLPPAQRLATAVTTGAFACLSPGDWEGLARRDELDLLSATEPVSR